MSNDRNFERFFHLQPNNSEASMYGRGSRETLLEMSQAIFKHRCVRVYLGVLPSFATFGRGRSSGSLWDSSCRFYAWTSILAWALVSHTALAEEMKRDVRKWVWVRENVIILLYV